MTYRLLQKADLQKGFLELLSQLTTVGNIPKSDFIKRFSEIVTNKNHRIYVLEQGKKIVSCATLFLEPKFIHECGLVGHVEDVVVDKACRGQKLGKKIIDFLSAEAERLGCYKILLDCSDKNVGFYEKCKYTRKGAYMAKYLNPKKNKIVEPFYKQAFNQVNKFCRRHYKGIAITGVVIGGITYYLYNNWNSNDESDGDIEE